MQKRNNIVLFCTDFHYLKIFFIEQTKLLANYGTLHVVCSATEEDFNKEFSQFKNIKHFNVKVGRKISLFSDFVTAVRTFFLLLSLRPIMVQSIFPKSGFLGMFLSWICLVPIRSHIFTGQVWATAKTPKKILLKFADKLIASCANHILADGQAQRLFLIENNIVQGSKIKVLGKGSISGVNFNKFSIAKPKPNRITKNFTCIFFGRMTREKGFNIILESFEYFGRSKEKIHLIVIGPDEDNFGDAITKINDSYSNISNMGFVEKPQDFLAISDLLLLPSHREGFGSVVIEAGAMAVPCIGSSIYGLDDAIINNETGIRIRNIEKEDLIEAILKLKNDQTLHNTLGNNAKKYALNNFKDDIVLANWNKYFIRLLEKK